MAVAAVSSVTSSVSRAADRQTLALLQAIGRLPDRSDPALLQQTAAQLVSELFFKPLLSELRSASFNSAFVGGGHAEAVFGSRLDEQLADTVAVSSCGGLLRQIVRRLRGLGSGGETASRQQPVPAVYA